jgi:hypothetical protein
MKKIVYMLLVLVVISCNANYLFAGTWGLFNISQPSIQATNISFSSITRTSMDISWTRGDGDACILLGREQYKIPVALLNDGSTYGANPNYSVALSIAGAKVLYNGSSNRASVTGLTRYQLVYFKVCEYNGVAGSEKYLQTENGSNPRSRWTLRRDGLMDEDMTIDAEHPYPNPVSNSISTTLDVFEVGNVSVNIYDIDGRIVSELYNQILPFGTYEFKFDLSGISSGTYQLIITKGSEAITYPLSIVR